MSDNTDYTEILADAVLVANNQNNAANVLQVICNLLVDKLETCDWAGFYIVNPNLPNELLLGPYCGAPTEHVRIPFGFGICGQTANTKKTFIVKNVADEENYLSCSPDVKSEIVVPIFHEGVFIGELDIDSHRTHSFSNDGKLLFEKTAALAALHLSQIQESMSRNE
ncbi:MAG: GAF domain-containing protein [FCB group bacterium]|nr:GAF domain-containing protein [FCB group bacterium]